MESKSILLRFRATDRDIFVAIKRGDKKFETRAASPKFFNIKSGGSLKLMCGKDSFKKSVKRARIFGSISSMLKHYKVKEINPLVKSKKELENMYNSFPNYKEKIRKYGLIVLELNKH